MSSVDLSEFGLGDIDPAEDGMAVCGEDLQCSGPGDYVKGRWVPAGRLDTRVRFPSCNYQHHDFIELPSSTDACQRNNDQVRNEGSSPCCARQTFCAQRGHAIGSRN